MPCKRLARDRTASSSTIAAVVGVISLMLMASVALSMFGNSFQTWPGSQNTTEYVASYILFKAETGIFCAKNGTSGRIDFAGSNETNVLQQAINSTATPGVIYLKSTSQGNVVARAFNTSYDYNFTSQINVKDGVSIIGNGARILCEYRNDTVFYLGNMGGETYELDAFNMRISGLAFIGDESNNLTTAIKVDGWSRGIIIEDIYTDSIAYPIVLRGACYNALIQQCRLIHGQTGIHLIKTASPVQYPSAVNIIGCGLGPFDEYAINVEGSTGFKCSNNYFEGNAVAVRLNYTSAVLDGNYFYVDVDDAGIVVNKTVSAVISNNEWIIKQGAIGINSTDFWTHLTVDGNFFTQYAGARTFYTNIETIASIGNNHCYITGTTEHSSFIEAILTRSSVIGNTVYGGNVSVNITNGAFTAITGNSINNGLYSLRLDSHDRATISGNVLRGTTADLILNNSHYNVIVGNTFYAPTKVSDCGYNIIKDNYGYITENYGTATIASSTSVVVTHGLSLTPTRILLTGLHNETSACYVTGVNATAFTINVYPATTGSRGVYWEAYGYDPTP